MLVRWNSPFRDIHSLQAQMNRLFSENFGYGRSAGEEGVSAAWAPPVDIEETPEQLAFSVEVPGFKHEDLQIRVENGVLTLEGERKFEEERKDRSYHRVERSYGKFFRSFALPGNVDVDRVNANLEDGVLRVQLPKKEEAKPKSIPIGGAPRELSGKRVA